MDYYTTSLLCIWVLRQLEGMSRKQQEFSCQYFPLTLVICPEKMETGLRVALTASFAHGNFVFSWPLLDLILHCLLVYQNHKNELGILQVPHVVNLKYSKGRCWRMLQIRLVALATKPSICRWFEWLQLGQIPELCPRTWLWIMAPATCSNL